MRAEATHQGTIFLSGMQRSYVLISTVPQTTSQLTTYYNPHTQIWHTKNCSKVCYIEVFVTEGIGPHSILAQRSPTYHSYRRQVKQWPVETDNSNCSQLVKQINFTPVFYAANNLFTKYWHADMKKLKCLLNLKYLTCTKNRILKYTALQD